MRLPAGCRTLFRNRSRIGAGGLKPTASEAQKIWDQQVATSLEQAVQLAAARIAAQGRQDVGRLRVEAEATIDAASRRDGRFAGASGEHAQSTAKQLRQEAQRAKASVEEVQKAAVEVTQFKEHIGAMQHNAAQELEQRMRDLAHSAAQEFDGRLEAAIADSAERIQPVVEAAEAQSVAWLNTKLEQDLAPHLEKAGEAIGRIEASERRAEEALRSHQDQLWQAAERSVRETTIRIQQSTEKVQKDWQEAARATIDKWLAEIDTRATDTTHSTIEALYKSAGWYERKVQTQMQSTMEKGLEQAAESLQAKAGEVSGVFATELDHYSRSFVDHAQNQLDDVGRSAVAKVEQKVQDAVEGAGAEISGRAREVAQQELERFSTGLRSAFDQTTAHLEAHTAQVQSQIAFDARQLLADFQRNLSHQSRENVAAATRQLELNAAAALESVRGGREMHEREFGAQLERTLTETLEAYKNRLENTSTAWLLSTAASLNQQAEQQIETLARDAEQRLKDVFAQVFMNVGNLLRERPLDISGMMRPAHRQDFRIEAANSIFEKAPLAEIAGLFYCGEPIFYSSASASSGDTRAARCEGRRQAARVTTAMTPAAPARIVKSRGGTWKRIVCIVSPASQAPMRPSNDPTASNRTAREKNWRRIWPGWAPSAMRTPISRRRCVTA